MLHDTMYFLKKTLMATIWKGFYQNIKTETSFENYLLFKKIQLINKQVLGKTICPFQKTINIFAQNIKSYMAI